MIKTARYILDEDKKLNEDIGLCSIYEFLYSYRDSVDSLLPDLTS